MSTPTPLTLSMPFKVASWKEETVEELGAGQKLTRATVAFSLTDTSPITSSSMSVHYVMAHTEEHVSAEYVGVNRWKAELEGRGEVSLVFKEVGTYKKGEGSASEVTVIEGTGTGAWKGVKGKGSMTASHAGGKFEVELTFPQA